MDSIFIENLVFWGRHGLLPHEKLREQPFTVDVEVTLDLTQASQSDTVKDTLDYSLVKTAVQKHIEGKRVDLLEHLAKNICDEILLDTRAIKVKITMRKTGIWREGVPGVTITRGRPEEK